MNNNYRSQRTFVIALILILILTIPAVALATDISVTADPTSVNAGDTVTVTVTANDKNVAVVNGTFTYDPSLLTYVSSDGGASDGYINIVSAKKGGSSSLTAVIKFKAIAKGNAKVNVSLNNVLGYDGKALDSGEGNVSINITSSGTSGDSGGKTTTAPAVDMSQNGIAAQNVNGASEKMYVWRSLSTLTLPSGYADKQVQYHGENVGGAAIPNTDGLILLYLSKKDGKNGGYYIYDKDKDTLFKYITITSVLANYTLMQPDNSVQVPTGYEKTTLDMDDDDDQAPAWALKGSDGSVYLIYARNSSGQIGFYLYNKKDESVQRYAASSVSGSEHAATPGASVKPSAAPSEESKATSGTIMNPSFFIVACAACGALLIAVGVLSIVLIKKNSRNKRKKTQNGGKDEKNDIDI